MNRKTLTALLAFAVLGVVAIVALRQPEKGERPSDRPRPIAKIDGADLDTLEISKPGGQAVTLSREPSAQAPAAKDGAKPQAKDDKAWKYKLAAPVAASADESNAKVAFDAVEKLDLTDLVSDQKTKQAEFEVDDAKAIHVVAKSAKQGGQGGKVLADLYFGKAAGAGTAVRPGGKDEIWLASGSLRYMFDKSAADWRDRTVSAFTAGDAEKIDVKAKDGAKITLTKKAKDAATVGEDKWEIGESSVKIDKLDNGIPNGIVSALASFKTNEFADAAKPEETGLDAPALTVNVALKGGKSVSVLVGNKKGDEDYYVKTADAPTVYLVKRYNLERVNKRPVEFRDKTLCDLAESDLGELAVTNAEKSFTLTKSGGAWKASKPAKLDLEASKVTTMAGALKDWKATAFAEDGVDAKAAGLAGKPKIVTAKAAKGGASCTVKVGGEASDKQSYYAQTAKSADIYVLPKWSADRFFVKPDDLKKGSGGGAPAGGPPMGMPNPHGGGMPNPHGGMPMGMAN